jgi:glucan 1,3-beta-glucosidase
MLVTADRFAALLHALGLSQGLFKPVPLLASPAITTNTINGTHHSTANSSSNLHSHADIPPLLLDNVNFQNLNQRDSSCHVDPYDGPDISDQIFAPFDQTEANVFRYRQQQSVNLGSW